MLIVSQYGVAAKFSPSSVQSLDRGQSGVAGLKLRAGDRVVAGLGVEEWDDLVLVTSKGVVLRVPVEQIPRKGRGTMGVEVLTAKSEGDLVVSAFVMAGAA